MLVLALMEAVFPAGTHETYQVPLGLRPADEGWDERVICTADGWTVYDGLADPAFGRELLHRMRSDSEVTVDEGVLGFHWAPSASSSLGGTVDVRPVGVEQSNSSIVFSDSLILKAFRRVEPGENPELELLRFLSARGFPNIAPLAGWYDFEGRLRRRDAGDPAGVPGRRARRLGARARRARLRIPTGCSGGARARRGHRRAAHGARLGGLRPGVLARRAEHGVAVDPDRERRRADRARVRRAARDAGDRADPRAAGRTCASGCSCSRTSAPAAR